MLHILLVHYIFLLKNLCHESIPSVAICIQFSPNIQVLFLKKSFTIEMVYISFLVPHRKSSCVYFITEGESRRYCKLIHLRNFCTLTCCRANLPHGLICSNALPFRVTAIFSITLKAVFIEKELHFTLLPSSVIYIFGFYHGRKLKCFPVIYDVLDFAII